MIISKRIPFAAQYIVEVDCNTGQVTIRNAKGYALRQREIDGYKFCTLSINGKQHFRGVHVLVCECFRGPRPDYSFDAGHIDGDRKNNMPDNLEWITKQENGRHRREVHFTVRPGEKNPAAKLTRFQARVICHVAALHRAYRPSAAQLGNLFGVSENTILKCWKGKTYREETKGLRSNFLKGSTFTLQEIEKIVSASDEEVHLLAQEFKVSKTWIMKLRRSGTHIGSVLTLT